MLKKGSWALLVVLCMLGWGCRSIRTRMHTASCTETSEHQYTLTVNPDGSVIPDCLTVKKGNTTLTWIADASAVKLTVEFDGPPGKHPDDPVCTGASCTLDKAKQKMKGKFSYHVTVVHGDQSQAQMDPILIIKP